MQSPNILPSLLFRRTILCGSQTRKLDRRKHLPECGLSMLDSTIIRLGGELSSRKAENQESLQVTEPGVR